MYKQLIKLEARGAQLESSGRSCVVIWTCVRWWSLLAVCWQRRARAIHNPGSVSYDRSKMGAFERPQRRNYRSGRPDSVDTAVLGQAAVGTGIAIVEGDFNIALGQEETEMDSNYMFLCGVMWCKFGQQEAGKELLRAANSVNPDMSALAWAMLAKGARRLRDLKRQAQTAIEAQ